MKQSKGLNGNQRSEHVKNTNRTEMGPFTELEKNKKNQKESKRK